MVKTDRKTHTIKVSGDTFACLGSLQRHLIGIYGGDVSFEAVIEYLLHRSSSLSVMVYYEKEILKHLNLIGEVK